MQKKMLVTLSLTTSIAWAGPSSDAYQHGQIIQGRVTLSDLEDPACTIKKPNEQLVVYISEKVDFLLPRKVKSALNDKGEFFFEVDSRYIDYQLTLAISPYNFKVYEKTLYAYNAPLTYDLTLSCTKDLKNWRGDTLE